MGLGAIAVNSAGMKGIQDAQKSCSGYSRRQHRVRLAWQDDAAMTYRDVWYRSDDGLKLYARDYPNKAAPLTLLCLHGLSRNSADFGDFGAELQDEYRVVAVDQRGRGRSEWDGNSANYTPTRYVSDMFTLIERLALEELVLVGTSMGGIMAMMMVAAQPDRFRGAVLNDIGPVVSRPGLARTMGTVGKAPPVKTWDDAIDQTEALNGAAFPSYRREDWARWVRRTYAENAAGEPQLLYDPAIADPLRASESNAAPPDAWPLFDAMRGVPVLALRGALSDILDEACFAEMQQRHPRLTPVTVPEVGHAPMLDEPGVVDHIRAFLGRIHAG